MKGGARNQPAASRLSTEVESARVRRGSDLSDAYGALLDAAASLPVEEGPSAVALHLLAVLSQLLPGRAFGACLVLPDSPTPVMELVLPEGMPNPGRDPTRLFPEITGECVFELANLPGSTLHVAPCGLRLDDAPLEQAVLERSTALLAAGVRTAMLLRAAKPVSVETTELRAQLIQAQKLSTLGQIVAGVVHELANPVTSIVAATELLSRAKDDAAAQGEHRRQVSRIRIAADRILKFSRDLVHYARPAREQSGPVVLNDVIEQALAFTQHEFERYGIEVGIEHDGDAPPVLGRTGPLTQVFVNLFTNAAHAMSDHGGRLTVAMKVDTSHARMAVEVMDTGVGMQSETLRRVFEPFFTTKEPGHGTGLGLAIVKEIVESHGGFVSAASTPGEGTTFVVDLPLFPSRS
jgi:two-component system NtrC family sensor kinase